MRTMTILIALLASACASSVTVNYSFDNGSHGNLQCSGPVIVDQVGTHVSITCPSR